MHQPKSYVVRIYRQGARSSAGVVEDVLTGKQQSFVSMQELWVLLRSSSRESPCLPAGRKPASMIRCDEFVAKRR